MGGSKFTWGLNTLGPQEFLNLPLDWFCSLLPLWKGIGPNYLELDDFD
jgi:hypothetical protein